MLYSDSLSRLVRDSIQPITIHCQQALRNEWQSAKEAFKGFLSILDFFWRPNKDKKDLT